jgi:hypothetical protein
LKELFLLPKSVLRARFVEELSEAVNEPERVGESYVVTPALVAAFDKGLSMVGQALASKRSVAGFVHGSFGSGKSHFMAMLHFLATGEEHAWRHPELHALRAKHAFVGKAKVLTLVFHMVGHASLAEAIAKRYLAVVRERHPDAPVPPVFADEALFEDARRLPGVLGDERFFAPLNEGAAGTASLGRWGALDAEGTWDRGRFERAAASSDPAERAELFGALVRTHPPGPRPQAGGRAGRARPRSAPSTGPRALRATSRRWPRPPPRPVCQQHAESRSIEGMGDGHRRAREGGLERSEEDPPRACLPSTRDGERGPADSRRRVRARASGARPARARPLDAGPCPGRERCRLGGRGAPQDAG